jgi:hypothetical protein
MGLTLELTSGADHSDHTPWQSTVAQSFPPCPLGAASSTSFISLSSFYSKTMGDSCVGEPT